MSAHTPTNLIRSFRSLTQEGFVKPRQPFYQGSWKGDKLHLYWLGGVGLRGVCTTQHLVCCEGFDFGAGRGATLSTEFPNWRFNLSNVLQSHHWFQRFKLECNLDISSFPRGYSRGCTGLDVPQMTLGIICNCKIGFRSKWHSYLPQHCGGRCINIARGGGGGAIWQCVVLSFYIINLQMVFNPCMCLSACVTWVMTLAPSLLFLL